MSKSINNVEQQNTRSCTENEKLCTAQ